MRHNILRYKLTKGGRNREFLLSSLSMSLFLSGDKIKTTITKAKALRPFAERLITLGKKGDLYSRRRIISILHGSVQSPDVACKLIDEIGKKYQDRNGGYTRIVRAGYRLGDGSEMAYIQLV
ncbi:50S ribosomal protein L17 [Candidatus Gromoviella agglomerans]|uniref:50S ribosomal protein L17 n=1 Tax=Candidatus Gromoviella agglomerans TaxID=2806609 RepID=UPI001E55C419|nr:50S ribosomal protein L17 [Candidatus Gromoviella agglomerans]UFX98321.1 50S ribosomal L17 domain protein [Candidatus Gromoviella agglomerans]